MKSIFFVDSELKNKTVFTNRNEWRKRSFISGKEKPGFLPGLNM